MDPKLKAKLLRQVKTTNKRLKSANVRVSVMVRGESLSLRAWLPSKYGGMPSQQTISLKLRLSEKTVSRAETRAHELQDDLDCSRFEWANWGFAGPKLKAEGCSASELITQFQEWKVGKSKNKTAALEQLKNQKGYFRKLESDKPLSIDLIIRGIRTTSPNSRSRQAMCILARQLARFGELSTEWFSEFVGSYDAYSSPKARVLPTDEEVIATWEKLTSPEARWAFGMIATYGLRPHELYHVDLQRLKTSTTIHIAEETKTGARMVVPLRQEWVEAMELQTPVLHRPRTADGRPQTSNKTLGNVIGKLIKKAGGPALYGLRHGYAIRAWRLGIDLELAAKLMGNSAKLQERVYRRWLEQDQLEQMVRQKLSA